MYKILFCSFNFTIFIEFVKAHTHDDFIHKLSEFVNENYFEMKLDENFQVDDHYLDFDSIENDTFHVNHESRRFNSSELTSKLDTEQSLISSYELNIDQDKFSTQLNSNISPTDNSYNQLNLSQCYIPSDQLNLSIDDTIDQYSQSISFFSEFDAISETYSNSDSTFNNMPNNETNNQIQQIPVMNREFHSTNSLTQNTDRSHHNTFDNIQIPLIVSSDEQKQTISNIIYSVGDLQGTSSLQNKSVEKCEEKSQIGIQHYENKESNNTQYTTNEMKIYPNMNDLESYQDMKKLYISENMNKINFQNSLKYANIEFNINQSLFLVTKSDDNDKIHEKSQSKRVRLNPHFSQRKKKFNILKFLIDNQDFSSDLTTFILNNPPDSHDASFFEILEKKLDISIIINRTQIKSKINASKSKKYSLPLSNRSLKNFCFFCKKKCIMFNSRFIYSKKYFNFLSQTLKANKQKKSSFLISDFFQLIHHIIQDKSANNFNSFILLFVEKRRSFLELIQKMRHQKLPLSTKSKQKLIEEIFHNFKCYHSVIKIRLIPEFISLLFHLLNQDIKIYHRRNVVMFLTFLFYLQSFDHAINIISQYDLFDEKMNNTQEHSRKIHKNIISLLLRINFIEPMVTLFICQSNVSYKYRFNVLSLFQLQCLSYQNKEFDKEKIEILTENICRIINNIEHINPMVFFTIYQDDEIQFLYSLNKSYFGNFLQIFTQFQEYEPHLKSISFKKDSENKDLKCFIRGFQERFAKCQNLIEK